MPVREDCLMSFSGNRSRQAVKRSYQVANRSRQVIAVGPQGETTSQRFTASEILRQSGAVL